MGYKDLVNKMLSNRPGSIAARADDSNLSPETKRKVADFKEGFVNRNRGTKKKPAKKQGE